MPWRPRHRKRPRSKTLAVHGAINNSDGRLQPVGRGDEWADFDTSARHQASAAPGAFRPPQRLGRLDRVTAIFQLLALEEKNKLLRASVTSTDASDGPPYGEGNLRR